MLHTWMGQGFGCLLTSMSIKMEHPLPLQVCTILCIIYDAHLSQGELELIFKPLTNFIELCLLLSAWISREKKYATLKAVFQPKIRVKHLKIILKSKFLLQYPNVQLYTKTPTSFAHTHSNRSIKGGSPSLCGRNFTVIGAGWGTPPLGIARHSSQALFRKYLAKLYTNWNCTLFKNLSKIIVRKTLKNVPLKICRQKIC